MAVGAYFLIAKINLSTLGALDDFSCNLYAAVGADGCFVADLTSALRTLDNSHDSLCFKIQLICLVVLTMSETNLPKLMVTHEPTLIHITVDTVKMPFTGVLPEHKVEIVFERRLPLRVLSYHDFVVAQQSQ